MSILRFVAIGLLSLSPALAHAELDCVVATREQGFDPRQPGAAELRRVALDVVSIVQRNAVFMAGNEPVRIRSTINYFGEDRLEVSVITTAYNEKAWQAKGCTISKFADRGGGLSDGTIAVFINNPQSLLGGRIGDATLVASGAPKRLGVTAGFPVYAAGGNEQSPVMLMSRSDYRPWVPVTVAEMLDWRERELIAHEREHQAAVAEGDGGFNEAKIDEVYRSMKKVNAAEAEKTRSQMLAALEKTRAAGARQRDEASAWMTGQRRGFDAYRASFTREGLAAEGTLSNSLTPDKIIRVDDPAGMKLARVDPSFAQRDPRRVHLIVVSLAPQPKTDPDYAWHQKSLDTLDYAALAKLLSP